MIIENFPIILQSITHFNKKVKKSQEMLEKEQTPSIKHFKKKKRKKEKKIDAERNK